MLGKKKQVTPGEVLQRFIQTKAGTPMVGEITMANKRLYAKIDMLECGRPLEGRRSR